MGEQRVVGIRFCETSGTVYKADATEDPTYRVAGESRGDKCAHRRAGERQEARDHDEKRRRPLYGKQKIRRQKVEQQCRCNKRQAQRPQDPGEQSASNATELWNPRYVRSPCMGCLLHIRTCVGSHFALARHTTAEASSPISSHWPRNRLHDYVHMVPTWRIPDGGSLNPPASGAPDDLTVRHAISLVRLGYVLGAWTTIDLVAGSAIECVDKVIILSTSQVIVTGFSE